MCVDPKFGVDPAVALVDHALGRAQERSHLARLQAFVDVLQQQPLVVVQRHAAMGMLSHPVEHLEGEHPQQGAMLPQARLAEERRRVLLPTSR